MTKMDFHEIYPLKAKQTFEVFLTFFEVSLQIEDKSLFNAKKWKIHELPVVLRS